MLLLASPRVQTLALPQVWGCQDAIWACSAMDRLRCCCPLGWMCLSLGLRYPSGVVALQFVLHAKHLHLAPIRWPAAGLAEARSVDQRSRTRQWRPANCGYLREQHLALSRADLLFACELNRRSERPVFWFFER